MGRRRPQRLMRRIKALLDPREPAQSRRVAQRRSGKIHLKNLKPHAGDLGLWSTRCIECGFCEPQCPSQGPDPVAAPAHRGGARNAAPALRRPAGAATARKWPRPMIISATPPAPAVRCARRSARWTSTPATLSAPCARGGAGASPKKVAGFAADHFALTLNATRAALAAGDLASRVLGGAAVRKASAAAHDALICRRLSPAMPRAEWPGARLRPTPRCGRCCSSPPAPAAPWVRRPATTARLCWRSPAKVFARAGYRLVLPEGLDDLCCGQPFASKGFPEIAKAKAEELAKSLSATIAPSPWCSTPRPAPRGCRPSRGRASVRSICQRSCATRSQPKLALKPVPETVAVHVTCSLRKAGLASALIEVASACAENVIAPPGVTCCGFAGDKGFSQPELNDHALRHLKESLPDACREGYSSSRTCEIGLAAHSGRRYRSILHLVDAASAR